MNQKWIDRKFEFDFDASIYPELIGRLRKTPGRLEILIKSVRKDLLKKRFNDDWSIQENAGHLFSADELFYGRLDDYLNGLKTLRAADVTGKRTDRMNFHTMDISLILVNFASRRNIYVSRLENLNPEIFEKTAWHPRLKVSMRLCDMLYFQAEHDDHHLNKINEILNVDHS